MYDERSKEDLPGYIPYPDERIIEYREAGLWEDLTFHEMLDLAAKRDPERPFAIGPHGTTSYAEVIEHSERIAAYFAGELGLKPHDIVAVQLSNRIEFLELFFACSRIGVIPVIVLPRHREAEAVHVVELTEAKGYVTIQSRRGGFDFVAMAEEVAQQTYCLEHLIAVGVADDPPGSWIDYSELITTDWADIYEELIESIDVDPNDPGVMLLSGGTTGMPKGIPRTHNDYVFQWRRWEHIVGIEPEWTLMPWVPIGHNASLNPIVGGAVTQGATIALEPRLKPANLLERTVKENVDFFFAVPTQLVDIVEFDQIDQYDLSDVHAVMSGGQKVRPRTVHELHERWGIGVCNIFGMAEGPLICTRPDDPVEVQAETVGRPVAPDGDEFRIVNERRTSEVDLETPGELAGRGPGVFTGYYRNPEENTASFDDEGWFYTEDVLELGADGNYRVYGRLKDTIIRGGENIYAPGVEDVLIEHPKIKNIAVVGMPDARLGERPMAYVELEDGVNSLSLPEVLKFLEERGIAVFKHPERLEITDSLPRTEVGKISKAELRVQITERLKAEGELPKEF